MWVLIRTMVTPTTYDFMEKLSKYQTFKLEKKNVPCEAMTFFCMNLFKAYVHFISFQLSFRPYQYFSVVMGPYL